MNIIESSMTRALTTNMKGHGKYFKSYRFSDLHWDCPAQKELHTVLGRKRWPCPSTWLRWAIVLFNTELEHK